MSKNLNFEVTAAASYLAASYLAASYLAAGYIVAKKKKISQTKHNPTQTAFHFSHTVPIPYTLTASSVKASANKSFLY